MSDPRQKRGLGRGLSALMADLGGSLSTAAEPAAPQPPRETLPIEQIVPNPDQPRRTYDPEALQELADSLKSRGVLQPLIVRPHPQDPTLYQIVAGERRWRAAQIAQLHDLPVIIREMDDSEVLEVALIENIQRADLNAMEEAASFRQLMDRFGHTQEKLSEALNKSRSHIANSVRLLTLPDQVQGWVRSGQLSAGHARTLVTVKNPVQLGRKIIDKGLSVREAETLARQEFPNGSKKPRAIRAEKDSDTVALEADLSAHLRMRVVINHVQGGGGQMVISYQDLDQLDALCRQLSGDF